MVVYFLSQQMQPLGSSRHVFAPCSRRVFVRIVANEVGIVRRTFLERIVYAAHGVNQAAVRRQRLVRAFGGGDAARFGLVRTVLGVAGGREHVSRVNQKQVAQHPRDNVAWVSNLRLKRFVSVEMDRVTYGLGAVVRVNHVIHAAAPFEIVRNERAQKVSPRVHEQRPQPASSCNSAVQNR